jgi:xanthine/uracil permease
MILVIWMKPFSASFWALLAVVVLLTLLLRAVLPYREGRAINIIIGLHTGLVLVMAQGAPARKRTINKRRSLAESC